MLRKLTLHCNGEIRRKHECLIMYDCFCYSRHREVDLNVMWHGLETTKIIVDLHDFYHAEWALTSHHSCTDACILESRDNNWGEWHDFPLVATILQTASTWIPTATVYLWSSTFLTTLIIILVKKKCYSLGIKDNADSVMKNTDNWSCTSCPCRCNCSYRLIGIKMLALY
jgi:hypothetical protein